MKACSLSLSGIVVGLVLGSSASAFPMYFEAWKAKYPNSSLPQRMEAATGSQCNVCHHPPARSVVGNCYRRDIIDLLGQGMTIEEALDALDEVDSDGDGVANGREANAVRSAPPQGTGYSMGLVGANGTDPCADDPNEFVSGELETPPPPPVPTASAWAISGMMVVLLAIGLITLVRRGRIHTA